VKRNNSWKKIGGIFGSILLYGFLGLCLLCVILTATVQKDADGAASVMGYQIRLVLTESMAACAETDVSHFRIKSIPARSLILLELVPEDAEQAEAWYADLSVGDVLTFRYLYNSQVTITHRIQSIEPEEGGYCITLLGDNKSESGELMTQVIHTGEAHSPNYVIGRVIASSYPIGLLLTMLREPIGLLFLVILPATLVMLYELVRVFSLLQAEKRRKASALAAEKEAELDALRRRVAMLEGTASDKEESHSMSDSCTKHTDGERTA
jgi:hypothetical protein